MFSHSDEPWGILGFVAIIVVAVAALTVGVGLHYASGRLLVPDLALRFEPTAPVADVAAEPVALEPAVLANDGSVQVEGGVIRFYFALGDAELPPGTASALTGVIEAAKSGRRLVITGFHDASGSPGRNASVARQRAQGLYAALIESGVPPERMRLTQPALASGTASANPNDAQARRVEIAIQ